ncbi:ketoacyl-synthetase C-terminal extension domain-containing protein, partial [Amycolatopsis antarctica]|uniref:ketoacyl-synthetase C-terminal extension domain-containing protein n=1 Tax=Amycolatopsis antarctica TaxID=1854586 RepID=UPI0023E7F746
MIKMVMAMRHGVVPRSLHVDEPTPHVDWSAGAVELVTDRAAWPVTDHPRRAGVSSFGLSGTNAHVVLEHEPVAPAPEPPVPTELVPWVISARSAAGLDAQRDSVLASVAGAHPARVGRALAVERSALEHRSVLLGGVEVARGVVGGGGVCFVFSGQGSQWLGMGRGLAG